MRFKDMMTCGYLVVAFNLSDENSEVLDAQCGIIVYFLVGPLDAGFRVSAERNNKTEYY